VLQIVDEFDGEPEAEDDYLAGLFTSRGVDLIVAP
jgi:hypothetical protein